MPSALVVHAHPDDEVFANAGRIVELRDAGWDVSCVLATGGEASEMATVGGDLAQARRLRLSKFERSLAVLGVGAWEWLADEGEWVDGGSGDRALSNEARAPLAAAVARCIESHAPDLILTVGEDGLTGHPDHVAIGIAVSDAARVTGFSGEGVGGARLEAAAVRAGQQLAGRLQPGSPFGTGRVIGSSEQLVCVDVSGSEMVRRQALDVYGPGLGTAPLEDVLARARRSSDSALLRSVFDTFSWSRECYDVYR